ncbi:MAG: thioredoxin family protein [Thermoplasmata archaeon]
MKIEVFGTGCAKCKMVEQNVIKAVRQLGIDAEIAKVDDIDEMVERGLTATPGLAIDGKLVAAGRVPSVEELVELLSSGGAKA